MVESREWKGRGGNELSAGACEREDCLKRKRSKAPTQKNKRKRFSCWHCGILSSEQGVNCFGLDLGPQLMFTLQIAILLLKIVHSDCKYAQIAPALKNIRLQDVEGMVKCLHSMNIFFFIICSLLKF